ncbi:MAG: guanylate kinase [Firmicutes bacterium]|nr:guanylate kinase [Bacillota bacterium]
MCKKGKLVVLSGPSGVGKGTICQILLDKHPELRYSVSATTRAPRDGEEDGVNYYFMSRECFLGMVKDDGFLEWAELFGNCYGTPAFAVDSFIEDGKSVILEIDTQGALQVMQKRPECVSLFILPPSIEVLEQRIRGRATEKEEDIVLRLQRASAELELAAHYRYQVVNDDLQRSVTEIENIFRQEDILPAIV